MATHLEIWDKYAEYKDVIDVTDEIVQEYDLLEEEDEEEPEEYTYIMSMILHLSGYLNKRQYKELAQYFKSSLASFPE